MTTPALFISNRFIFLKIILYQIESEKKLQKQNKMKTRFSYLFVQWHLLVADFMLNWNKELECGFIKTRNVLMQNLINIWTSKLKVLVKSTHVLALLSFLLCCTLPEPNISNFYPDWVNVSNPCTQSHIQWILGKRTTFLPSSFCNHSKHPSKWKVLIELKCKLCECKDFVVYF